MKHYELSVYASDSNFNLNIDGIYQAEKKLIVLANLKREPGVSLATTTWFSVGVEIDAPEDFSIECYLTGSSNFENIKNTYTHITQEKADKLVHGLIPIKFTQTHLNPDEVEFVIKYKEQRKRIHHKYSEMMELLAEKAKQREAEFKKQRKDIEPIDPWTIEFRHLSPKVIARISELAEQNQLENKAELQKLIDERTLELNTLIKPKLTFVERMEKFTGMSRQGLFTTATAGAVAVVAASVELIRQSRP
ncbi:MAG: hypothetical protein ACYCQI_12250 [Gammaproteobacteria bacterium]